MSMVRMDIESIVVGNGPATSLITLRPRHSSSPYAQTQLPIRISMTEASAIGLGVDNMPHQRPLTPDLLQAVITQLGATVTSVTISKVEGPTFFASVHLLTANKERKAIDCRPSDAVALAVRTKAPIFAESDVLMTASYPDFKTIKKDEQEKELAEFHSFIEGLSPEDFS